MIRLTMNGVEKDLELLVATSKRVETSHCEGPLAPRRHSTMPTPVKGLKPEPVTETDWPSASPLSGFTVKTGGPQHGGPARRQAPRGRPDDGTEENNQWRDEQGIAGGIGQRGLVSGRPEVAVRERGGDGREGRGVTGRRRTLADEKNADVAGQGDQQDGAPHEYGSDTA